VGVGSGIYAMDFHPVGARYSAVGADQARCPASWVPMFRILYRFLTSLARLAVRSGRSKDLEIIVLRHQLGVLGRQASLSHLNDDDRTLLGAIAARAPPAAARGLARHARHAAALAPTPHRRRTRWSRSVTRSARPPCGGSSSSTASTPRQCERA
jgi:hypothetical protein